MSTTMRVIGIFLAVVNVCLTAVGVMIGATGWVTISGITCLCILHKLWQYRR